MFNLLTVASLLDPQQHWRICTYQLNYAGKYKLYLILISIDFSTYFMLLICFCITI